MEHWAKKFFEKITPKHVQNTFGHFWEPFWEFMDFWKFFYQKTFRRLDPMEHRAKNIFEKFTPKHVQNTFGQFGNDFARFWNFEKFLIFFKNISKTRSSMEHWTKKLFRKITPKHVQNTLGHFREQFGHLWNFEFFLIFWNHFEDSTLHGTLGKKHFRKNYTKTCSKHVGQFGNDFWAFFGILKNILKTFRRLDPPWNTGQKSFSEKITPKHVRNTFGQFGNNLGVFGFLETF